MNFDSLNAALVVFLNKVISNAEKGGEFLAEQIPDVIQQLLMWKMVASIISFILALILFGIVVCSFKHIHKYVCGYRGYEPAALLYGFPIVGFVVAVLIIDLTWLKILIAPKVYLIEYAASLVK